MLISTDDADIPHYIFVVEGYFKQYVILSAIKHRNMPLFPTKRFGIYFEK
jgi:hypothetical protein